jgi:hypothetical protein
VAEDVNDPLAEPDAGRKAEAVAVAVKVALAVPWPGR